MISGEYGSGTITASLAAVPQRWPLLAAKAIILTGLTLPLGLVVSFGAFSIGQGLLSGTGLEVALGDPGVTRAVVGAGAYLTLVTILGLGLGALLRHTTGAIAVLVGLLLLLGPLSAALPSSWQDAIGPYLPAIAGDAMMALTTTPGTLDPWTGFAVLTAYALVTLAVATLLLLRRDT